MQLALKDFASLVRMQAGAAAASCRQLVDVAVGSVLRAILEANASVGLWIQWLIVEVLRTTRAGTSQGADLDTWVADFGMARLPASQAAGSVRLGRATAGLATVVPVGALVRSGLGSDAQLFAVAADTNHPRWTGSGYWVAAADLAIEVPAVAQVAGGAGNVQAGAITLLASAIPGIDSVTNAGAMSGGLDAESDEALRTRFAGFMDSRTRATPQAVSFAILSLRQGLSFRILERVDAAGAIRAGHFTVTVDDGTGAPSPDLLGRVGDAIEAVRPIGATFSVRGPTLYPVEIELHVDAPAEVQASVRAAVAAYLSGPSIGQSLPLSRLYQLAHDANSRVAEVRSVTLNGRAGDVVVPADGLIRVTAIWVSA